ncbi:hypothetical protein [Streptomyces sp. NPDC050988]|uniref:hypothetical protein n=1 Tax=Streptomyces sp. NPDC050988 TaxID=3365637 RepID=UPI003788A15C
MPQGAYRTGILRPGGQATADEVRGARPCPARTSSGGRTGAVDDDPPWQRHPAQGGPHRPETEQGGTIRRRVIAASSLRRRRIIAASSLRRRCVIRRSAHTADIRLRTIGTRINVA